MKKLIALIMILVATATAASARDKYYRDASVLPVAAQTQLKKDFKAQVSIVKIDKTMGQITEYEVVLTDGTEIDFDKAGNWKTVEVRRNSEVPRGIVPEAIRTYVKNAQNQKIVGIEKDRKKYEVELANGVEMQFDLQGNFIRYSD